MSSVYAIPVGDRWLLHAPLHRLTALVNRAAVVALREGQPVTELSERLAAGAKAPQPRRGPVDPQFLGLIPTRACNLRCAYCGFGAASAPAVHMNPRLATAAIDWMAERVCALDRKVLDVHFFGGEPLSAIDVVDVAVHRTRAVASARGLTPRLEIATNGVCSEDRALFLGDYFDCVVLSLDGPREIHDLHRPVSATRGSFDQVARSACVLSACSAQLCLRVCVSEANVRQLSEIVRWYCDEFSPTIIDIETLQVTAESQRAGLREPDPLVFAAEYWRARQAAADHGIQAIYSAAETSTPRLTFCPVSQDALMVSPDGRVSGCYLLEEDWQARGLDLNLGRLRADGTMTLDEHAVDLVRRLAGDKPRCMKCFCRWSCAGGCHVNHRHEGEIPKYDDFCVQTRLVTAFVLLEEIGAADLVEPLLTQAPAPLSSDCLEDWGAILG